MLEALVAMVITFLVLAVVVPLALAYLLLRQVLRSRPLRWLRGGTSWAAPTSRFVAVPPRAWGRSRGGVGTRGLVPPQHGAALARPWSGLASDAVAARNRFAATVEQVPPGPLRATLAEAVREVDLAVAEGQRLAAEGTATDHAHRQVLAALDQQRRRSRRGPHAPLDLADSLAAATAAQQASAARLGEASRTTLCQLQLVVARLSELTAHTLELATVARAPHAPPAVVSIADRLAALRAATVEVELTEHRLAL